MWAWLLLALHRAWWSRCEENERAGEGDGAEKARRTHRSSDRLTWINMETPTYDTIQNHRVLTTISFSVWPHIQQSRRMHYVTIHYIMSLRGSWFTTTTLIYVVFLSSAALSHHLRHAHLLKCVSDPDLRSGKPTAVIIRLVPQCQGGSAV